MTGRWGGMATLLKQLIRQHCAIKQTPFRDFHSVWCLAHRLNLVTKDFMNLSGPNIVKSFSDLFADSRRQTAYKTFLSHIADGQTLRRVPKPSDTRWLFYADVVSSILSQQSSVEKFISGQESFVTFWDSLKNQKRKFGMLVENDFSLKDVKFRSLFLFVQFVLRLLGRVNRAFQERYLMLWEAWCLVNSLKKHLLDIVTSLQLSPSSFTFMTGLGTAQAEEYSSYIHEILQSLSLRFPCPSISHDMHGMRTCFTIDFDETSIEHNPFEMTCSISEFFNCLSFDSITDRNNSSEGLDSELADELQTRREQISHHKKGLYQQKAERNTSISELLKFEVDIKFHLTDVLPFVQGERLPRAWKES